MTTTILSAKGLEKSFGAFRAVASVDLSVETGSIHALIGPNGAGKTTVFNLLTKFLQPTGGTIKFAGCDITRKRPVDVARLGMIRSFQISSVFPQLTVLENVRLALQRQRGESFDFWRSGRVLSGLEARARSLLCELGIEKYEAELAANLPYGRKRALEIATTLALDPKLMLLDEPTAGMGHEDIDRVIEMIRRVRVGRTILMVEHNLSVVSGLSDVITVLARGRVLAEGNYDVVSSHPDVRAAYIGVDDA